MFQYKQSNMPNVAKHRTCGYTWHNGLTWYTWLEMYIWPDMNGICGWMCHMWPDMVYMVRYSTCG